MTKIEKMNIDIKPIKDLVNFLYEEDINAYEKDFLKLFELGLVSLNKNNFKYYEEDFYKLRCWAIWVCFNEPLFLGNIDDQDYSKIYKRKDKLYWDFISKLLNYDFFHPLKIFVSGYKKDLDFDDEWSWIGVVEDDEEEDFYD